MKKSEKKLDPKRVERVAETASEFYERGSKFIDAVNFALSQHGITGNDWGAMYREVCGILGKRGGRQTAMRKRGEAEKTAPAAEPAAKPAKIEKQMSFDFSRR